MLTPRNTWLQVGFLFVFLVVGCGAANAQANQSVSVNTVRKQGNFIVIKINFETPLEKEDQGAAKLASNYSILDTVEKKYLEVCADAVCSPKILFPGGIRTVGLIWLNLA